MNYEIRTEASGKRREAARKQPGYTQKFLRKRKMMLIMPILVLPFVTLAFWAMGGGKVTTPELASSNKMGLNLNLPDANLKEDKLADKLSFYEKADKDSLKVAEWMRSDPYYRKKELKDHLAPSSLELLSESAASRHNQPLNVSPYEPAGDNPEQKIMEKLALLNQEINKPPAAKKPVQPLDIDTGGKEVFADEVERLENMMHVISKTDSEDTTMTQLEKTLDKILDVQHPERVRERYKEKSNDNSFQPKEIVFAVSSEPADQGITLLDSSQESQDSDTGFFGIEEERVVKEQQNAIEAVVHENQILVNGAIIKLRLLKDNYINGSRITKGSFVFGIVALHDERLEISIPFLRNENSLFPVKLEVYDLDGLPGIYIPGGITREVAKQSADNSLQLMELGTMDPSFKAQATAAGISAAKSLLSKKVKQVKVQVKAGYRVLLKDKNSQQ